MTKSDPTFSASSSIEREPRTPWTPEGQLLLQWAFTLLGEKRFGDAWTGDEWAARHGVGDPPKPPEEPKAGAPSKVRQADGTLREMDRPVRFLIDGSVKIIPYELALQRYENEKDALLERWQARYDTYNRFCDAWDELRQALHSKHLSSVALDRNGFTTKVPEYKWASADALKILETGRIRFSAGDPYFPVRVEGDVLVSEKSLKAYLGKEAPTPPTTDAGANNNVEGMDLVREGDPTPKARRRGRLAKWEWEDCFVEICRIVHLDGLPKSQAEMVRKLQDWFISQVDDHPAESEVKKRVSKVFRAIQAAENSKDS